MKLVLQVLLFLFPWKIRRFLLNKIFHYQIHSTAKIGFSVILANKLIMAEQSRIHNFTVCKQIDRLVLKKDSGIASWNLITGFSSTHYSFSNRKARVCELILGEHSGITFRHLIDCNGGVYIDDYTTVAGYNTQILTHSINIYENTQETKPVFIGKYCFIGTKCILLPGCCLPDYSILGAGSVLNKHYTECYYIYAGNPAKAVKSIDKSNTKYFYRTEHVVD
jgi:acetyltransferase-like isoleucine patch superfamily enzyme